MSPTTRPIPVVPDYRGACVSNIVPALLEHRDAGLGWMPEAALDASQVVLLVIDGLGADQLACRQHLAPNLSELDGDPICTVAPSTTGAALTSITTGMAPSQHGVIGYRVRTSGETLNVLRWSTESGDARERIIPSEFQLEPCFAGESPTVVTRREFLKSGFTAAHLSNTELRGYNYSSTLITEVKLALASGSSFVYAYYDGIDRIAHEFGFGDHYEAELIAVDRMVGDLLAVLPSRAVLVVTADHGQVHVGDAVTEVDSAVLSHAAAQSGEARFRWLHAVPGHHGQLLDASREAHGHHAWVFSYEETLDLRLFGPRPSANIAHRFGDVALVPFESVAFVEPKDTTPTWLIGRHGSLTPAEMMVPLLVGP